MNIINIFISTNITTLSNKCNKVTNVNKAWHLDLFKILYSLLSYLDGQFYMPLRVKITPYVLID